MPLFGEDPKDLLIASQKEEIQYLRVKVDDLTKELLALTSSSAYRLVHQEQEPEGEGVPLPPTPAQRRHGEPVKPNHTLAEIRSQWPGGDS